jgi:hypothetical protein
MSTQPMPVPQQPQPQQAPSVSENVAPIADAARQAQQDKPGVNEAKMGQAPVAQKTEGPSAKRVVLSVLGAAAGMGPMVQKINQQHNQNVQIQNQHVIDTVWNAHKAETDARNRVEQLKPIVEEIDKHWNEANQLPDDDPTKVQKVGYLAHLHAQVVGEIKQAAQTVQQSQQQIQGLLSDPKNRKIMGKAVGYDEKQANTPERQQMVAAIQKSIPGTGGQEAQLESQFPQGASEGQKGLTPAVTDQVLKSATTQAQIGERGAESQLKAQTTEDVAKMKATGTRGKTGVLFDQGVPFGWTAPDGKQYTIDSPDIPPEGKQMLEAANTAYQRYVKLKGEGSEAAKLRAKAYWANYLLHAQGIGLDNKPLAGSMQTDTGETVGTANAPNVRPTGTERVRADLAASAKEQMASMESLLKKRSDLFGPTAGRATDFTQWIGSQDPDAQAFQASARIVADHLAGVFGGRSEAALAGIYNVIGKNKTNPAAAIAALEKMNQAATIIQKKGTVRTVGSSTEIKNKPAAKSSAAPAGATMKVPGSDGKMHWSDGKKDLGVAE